MAGAVAPPQWRGNRSAIHALATLAKYFHLIDCIIYVDILYNIYVHIQTKYDTMSTCLQQSTTPFVLYNILGVVIVVVYEKGRRRD